MPPVRESKTVPKHLDGGSKGLVRKLVVVAGKKSKKNNNFICY